MNSQFGKKITLVPHEFRQFSKPKSEGSKAPILPSDVSRGRQFLGKAVKGLSIVAGLALLAGGVVIGRSYLIGRQLEDSYLATQQAALTFSPRVKVQGVPVYRLLDGWNFISFASQPHQFKTAKELVADVKAQGGYITTVSRWDGDRWDEYVQRADLEYGEDFEIEPLVAYFVRSHEVMNWQVPIESINPNKTYQLTRGWNAVGIPNQRAKAEEVLDEINKDDKENATEIDQWVSGNWDVFVKRIYSKREIETYGNNFNLSLTRGYMIRLKKDAVWEVKN